MASNIENAVHAALGERPSAAQAPGSDAIHSQELSRGSRAKRVLDRQRSNQNYYRTSLVQKELLDHYENVDWFERDAKFDFVSYMES